MGGSDAVFEGKMSADTITLTNLQLKGVNDGTLYATVMMLDSTQALIGIGKASYTKDTKVPTNYNLTTNKDLLGKSNLDSLIISIKSVELNSENIITIIQKATNPNYSGGLKNGDSVLIQKKSIDTLAAVSESIFSTFSDGLIEVRLTSTDSVGNMGSSIIKTIYKDTKDPILTIINDSSVALKLYLSINSNEFVSNKPSITDFVVNNGTISGIEKISPILFKLTVDRICSDSLQVKLNPNVLLDTVANGNATANFNSTNPLAPIKPAIAWNGTDFTATTTSTGVIYQWLLNSSSVSGATNDTYKPTAMGSYKIQITDANGCKNLSDSFMLVVTAVNPSIETSTDRLAKVFPNPASTNVVLYFKQKPNKNLTIKLLNLRGQVLKQVSTNSQTTHILLNEIITGNCIIEIIGKGYNQTQQLLIKK